MCYSMYHCTKEITSWHLTKFTSRLIRCLCPAAEFLFDPHCSSSSFPCPPPSLILLSCHGRSQVHYDLIPLHMSESLSQIVVIHELIAARIRPRGSMCMEKRIPEGLISKLSATLAETRTKSFLNCLNWKATGCLSAYELLSETNHRGMTVAKSCGLWICIEILWDIWFLCLNAAVFWISSRTHLNVGVAG